MQHRAPCRCVVGTNSASCSRFLATLLLPLLLQLLPAVPVTQGASIHHACESDVDCESVPNTFCKGHECICLPKFSRSYPPCHEGIELGESCSRHENCEVIDNNSYCHHSICRCKPLFRRVLLQGYNVTRCRRGHEPQESCYNVEDCNGSNYTCSEGLCKCQKRFYKDEETAECRPMRHLDEECTRDSDCDSLVNNSHCSSEHCVCKNGYIREGTLPDEQLCAIERGGRGALEILLGLMLPVVVGALVYLYRSRKAGQANNESGEEDQESVASRAPLGTHSTDTEVKSPSVSTLVSPMPPDIITGSPLEVRSSMDTRGKPPYTLSIKRLHCGVLRLLQVFHSPSGQQVERHKPGKGKQDGANMGMTRSTGLCNFNPEPLGSILSVATFKPASLQMENSTAFIKNTQPNEFASKPRTGTVVTPVQVPSRGGQLRAIVYLRAYVYDAVFDFDLSPFAERHHCSDRKRKNMCLFTYNIHGLPTKVEYPF